MMVDRTEEMCDGTSTPLPIKFGIDLAAVSDEKGSKYVPTTVCVDIDPSSAKDHEVKGNDSCFEKEKSERELVDLGWEVGGVHITEQGLPVRRPGFLEYLPVRIIFRMVSLLTIIRQGSAETTEAAAPNRYLQDSAGLFSGEDCVNLTLAFLPSFIEEEAPIEWSLMSSSITVMDKNYSDPALFNTVISDDEICLVPGTYSLNISTTGLATAHYIVYSEGQVIECGGVHQDSHELSIALPFDPTISNSTCSLSLDCNDVNQVFNATTESDCFAQAFTTLQCYNIGIEVDVTAAAQNSNGDRNSWFGVSCARALSDMCASRESLGFGLGNESPELQSQNAVDEFCNYFDCGSTSFESFLEGGTLHEFYGCECRYTEWTCALTGAKCDMNECCVENGVTRTSICDCRIEPDCENGNTAMCSVAFDYCCSSKSEAGREDCEKRYSHYMCLTSVKNGDTEEDEDYPYCHKNAELFCQDEVDPAGCRCQYWIDLCEQNSHEVVCEGAIEYCCPGDTRYMSYCYCDFYNWADTIGYTSDKKDGWCSTSLSFLSALNTPENDAYGLRELYQNLGGQSWLNNDGWMSQASHCDWYGVQCSEGRVTQLDLSSNNLTGDLNSFGKGQNFGNDTGALFELEELDFSNNNLKGVVSSEAFYRHRKLSKIDLSRNKFNGFADVLIAPAITYVNYSHNEFTSLGHILKSRQAYNKIEAIDLGQNLIYSQARDFFTGLPPGLKKLNIRDNELIGSLPTKFTSPQLAEFDASNNLLTGVLPDLSESITKIEVLKLSRQKISGSIPPSMSSLLHLVELDLSSNGLTASIPPTFGNIPLLKLLNLSNNELTGSIDGQVGKLSAISEVFDISNNRLEGRIPETMKDFVKGQILLGGNDMLETPAPLGLCYDSTGFDLKDDLKFCPLERNALKEFFDTTKGREWTTSELWGDQFVSICEWYGVTCNKSEKPIRLDLSNNALSGKLSEGFGRLVSFEEIDLSDNDIKGRIPSTIGQMESLRLLRLSYNQFTSTIPDQLMQLQNLELAHFQSNRLTGVISLRSELLVDDSSFISDCGVPTQFEDPLTCDNCTMCCNVEGGCHTTEEPLKYGLTYMDLSYIIIAIVSAVLTLFALIKYLVYNPIRYKGEDVDSKDKTLVETPSIDEAFEDSVYYFFITPNWVGWIISISVLFFQFHVFGFFIKASQKDFADDKSDFTYSYRCPRNSLECSLLADQTLGGCAVFWVLMLSHLGVDFVKGWKLIHFSTQPMHTRFRRARFFVSGTFTFLLTTTACYASFVYNVAVARSNAELVANAVIVLFLCDLDEQIFGFMEVACPDLLDSIMGRSDDEAPDDADKDGSKLKYLCARVGAASWYRDEYADDNQHELIKSSHKPFGKSARVEVDAPAGQLGITLRGAEGPTRISAVQSDSVLAGKVGVGDVIVSIDGVDVSNMNSTQIKQILTTKNEFQRLIVIEPAKQQSGGVDFAEPVQRKTEVQVKFRDEEIMDDNSICTLRKAIWELRAQISALEKKTEELENRSCSDKSGNTESAWSFNGDSNDAQLDEG